VQEHGRIVYTVWLLNRKGNWQIRMHERVEVWAEVRWEAWCRGVWRWKCVVILSALIPV